MQNSRGGMRDETVFPGPGLVLFQRRDAGCFEINGGMWDQTYQKWQGNATSATRSSRYIDEDCLSDYHVSAKL